ncbi:MAG: serine hydrolase domain-containing protein [Paracoccaceae bacterium]
MQALLKFVVVIVWLAQGAAAQDNARIERMQTAFDSWLDQSNAQGVAAVAFKGAQVATLDGGQKPDTPAELASVSKSITAICGASLVEDGLLAYTDTVLGRLGRGPDTSVASLVTHSSGLVDDVTQSLMLRSLDKPKDSAPDVLDAIGPAEGAVGVYAYNNVNYALLGLLIEDAANAPYEDTCRQRVLDPAGATGMASPRSGASLSWGGWYMIPADYAALHSYWFSTQTEMGSDPFAYPHVEVVEGVYYGLGTFFRKSRRGHNFWHHGALCMPGRLNIGSFAVTWRSEWSIFVSYDQCVDWNEMTNLDLALGQAAYGALE